VRSSRATTSVGAWSLWSRQSRSPPGSPAHSLGQSQRLRLCVNQTVLAKRYGVMTSSHQLPAEPVLGADDAVELPSNETFDAFYFRELPGLVLLARALTGSAYADDVAQEAMLEAYRRWDDVRHYDSPTGWVRRVCANKAVSGLRRREVEARALLRWRAQRPVPVTMPGDSAEFWSHVRRLPKRQAQSVALFYLYDLSVSEVAATLGCSLGSVKVHLSRGRAALARSLGESIEGDPS